MVQVGARESLLPPGPGAQGSALWPCFPRHGAATHTPRVAANEDGCGRRAGFYSSGGPSEKQPERPVEGPGWRQSPHCSNPPKARHGSLHRQRAVCLQALCFCSGVWHVLCARQRLPLTS